MTFTKYLGLRFWATGGGVVALGLLGYSNVYKLVWQSGLDWSNPTVLLAGAPAVLGTIALAVAAKSLSNRWMFATLLLLAVGASHASDAYNALEGLLYGREARLQSIRDHNAAVDRAEQAKTLAESEVQRLQGKVTEETLSKCKSICEEFKSQLVIAKADLVKAEAEVLKLGIKRSEENIVAKNFTFVSAVWAETLPSLMTTFSVLAFSILLFCYGHGSETQVAVETPSEVSADVSLDAQSERAAIKRVLAALKDEAQSNDELARRLGVPKGTASKWATAAEDAGLIRRHRDGREVRIRRVA